MPSAKFFNYFALGRRARVVVSRRRVPISSLLSFRLRRRSKTTMCLNWLLFWLFLTFFQFSVRFFDSLTFFRPREKKLLLPRPVRSRSRPAKVAVETATFQQVTHRGVGKASEYRHLHLCRQKFALGCKQFLRSQEFDRTLKCPSVIHSRLTDIPSKSFQNPTPVAPCLPIIPPPPLAVYLFNIWRIFVGFFFTSAVAYVTPFALSLFCSFALLVLRPLLM